MHHQGALDWTSFEKDCVQGDEPPFEFAMRKFSAAIEFVKSGDCFTVLHEQVGQMTVERKKWMLFDKAREVHNKSLAEEVKSFHEQQNHGSTDWEGMLCGYQEIEARFRCHETDLSDDTKRSSKETTREGWKKKVLQRIQFHKDNVSRAHSNNEPRWIRYLQTKPGKLFHVIEDVFRGTLYEKSLVYEPDRC